jgi:N-acetylneuraminic acid mutarotase
MTNFKEALLMTARQKELSQSRPGGGATTLSLVTVGGIDLQSLDPDVPGKLMYCYSSAQNNWGGYGCRMTNNLHHHGIAVVNNKLYVIGGSVSKGGQNLGVATDEVAMFDPSTAEWKKVASMTSPRAYLATAVWRNTIYAVGGENQNKQKLDSIECFDVELNQWRALTHLPGGARVGPAAAVHQDGLFVVGGYNRNTHKRGVLENVAFYDLLYKRWIVLNPLVVPRCHASLVVIDNRLFLIGGRTRLRDSKSMTSVDAIEEYNLDSDKWTQKTAMKHGRHDMGCTAIGTRLYIVGGIKSPNPACVSSVECFDIATNEWIENVATFPHSIAGVSCASLLITEQEPFHEISHHGSATSSGRHRDHH